MPITSPPRKVTETENMLRLLLCVDALGSVTSAQLWTFAAEQELMDYLSMRICLHKLLAAGELENGEGSLQEQLLLTDRGREALALFGERLPVDVRERVRHAAPAYRLRVQRNRQVQAVYEMARPGDYRLNLSVCEGDLPTVRLKLITTNRTLASKAIHRFGEHAARMTTYLYGLAAQAVAQTQSEAPALDGVANMPDTMRAATGGEPPLNPARESSPPAPGAAPQAPTDAGNGLPSPCGAPPITQRITEHSATEFTAFVTLKGKRATFEAALLLPTRTAAEAFVRALGVPRNAADAADRLATLLGGSTRKRSG